MRTNVLEDLEVTAGRLPEKIAFANDKTQYTFRQMKEYSDAIGTALAQKGHRREPVLIFMKKGPEEIAGFFGIIRSSCYYVPIDEEMPATRVALIIENCGAKAMIVDEETAELEVAKTSSGEVLQYSELIKTQSDAALLQDIRDHAIDTDPIYIVFTSGSTGVPKGVCACHRSVLDYIEQLSNVLGFGEDTVFGNQSPLYFDACLKELYPTIRFGATTYLIPHELFSFPKKLVEYLNEKQINTICWVVSALTMISAFSTFDDIKPETLRTIAFGSEVFPIKQFELWRNALPNASFTNLYGPTEATGMSCFFHVDRERHFEPDEPIPIGRPFKNTEIMLLSEDGKLVDKGETGEICIRGTCLTLGYFNDYQRTDEVFVQNPLNDRYHELIYKTGDLGRLNENNELIFISRKDYQIKHMGHRIELSEIEVIADEYDGIGMSAASYDKEKGKISLFYQGDASEKDVVLFLKEHLPRYMLPNRTVKLDKLPFTANGKIDRKSLQDM